VYVGQNVISSYRAGNVDVALVIHKKSDTLDVASGSRRQQRRHSLLQTISARSLHSHHQQKLHS